METTAVLQIHILDINDNKPLCLTDGVHCEIPEHSSTSTPLSGVDPDCRFRCQDADSKFGRMTFHPDTSSPDCFIDVGPDGEIRLTRDLDIEMLDRVAFICTVKVRDADNPTFEISQSAHFTIVDVNDNAPAPDKNYVVVIPFENNTADYVHPEPIRFADADRGPKNGADGALDIQLDSNAAEGGVQEGVTAKTAPESSLGADNVTVEAEPDQRSVKLKLKTPLDVGEWTIPLKACDGESSSSGAGTPRCQVHHIAVSVLGPPDSGAIVGVIGPVHIIVIVVAILLLMLLILFAVCLTQMRERKRRNRLPDQEEVSEITRYNNGFD